MSYFYLAIAIIAEVIATSSLKASHQFTRLMPSLLVLLGYGIAFYCLSLVLKKIPVGITYAIWSGVGIVLITIVGKIIYQQEIDLPGKIGIGFIVIGVLIINLLSKSTH